MNASVRDVIFDHDQSQLYCVSRNKAVCSYDVETGKRSDLFASFYAYFLYRVRCIVNGTKNRPNVLCLLPPTARKHQQFATGDEEGQASSFPGLFLTNFR